MPKEATHVRFADKVAPLLKDSAFSLSPLTLPFYRYGSILPDMLYYDVRLPWEKEPSVVPVADALHGKEGEDTLKISEAAVDFLTNSNLQKKFLGRSLTNAEREKGIHLFCGYLTHVALDATLHPVIYSLTGNYYHPDSREQKRSVERHRALETLLDLFVLGREGKSVRSFYRNDFLRLRGEDKTLVASLFSAWLLLAGSEFTDKGMSGEKYFRPLYKTVLRALNRQLLLVHLFQHSFFRTLSSLLSCRIPALRALFYPAENFTQYLKRKNAFDFQSVKVYTDPLNGLTKKINPPALEKRAMARARKMLSAFLLAARGKAQVNDMRRVLRGYSLNNGRVAVPVSRMQHYSLLPLSCGFRYNTGVGS